MNRARAFFGAVTFVAATFAGLPSAWAESQVGDPGPFGITVDPNASGTKVSGPVTLSYQYEDVPLSTCQSRRFVRNLYAVATLTKGNQMTAFSSNYVLIGRPDLADCFENQVNQMAFLKLFIDTVIMPGFFGCAPGSCPPWVIKSVENFLTTGVGAGYFDVVIAVKQ